MLPLQVGDKQLNRATQLTLTKLLGLKCTQGNTTYLLDHKELFAHNLKFEDIHALINIGIPQVVDSNGAEVRHQSSIVTAAELDTNNVVTFTLAFDLTL
jgi:hypothetical protein